MRLFVAASAAALACAFASPSWASPEDAPSARELQSKVDAYLASAQPDASLVGGAGTSGYDGGFWVRGGSFLLKINLTLQTRWEGFDWDDKGAEPSPGGDLSGFSIPRVTLKFSGDATCNVRYYAELEFGHHGLLSDNGTDVNSLAYYYFDAQESFDNHAFDSGEILREGWIEYQVCRAFTARMGLVKLPTTRQLMTPPELQQFADVSLASAFVGPHIPGYTDRNRDYGLLFHGAVGCDDQFSYLVSVTNGDGPVHRNVLDGSTNDNLAYAARVNWDIKGHLGYEEGALRQRSCEWAAAVGAWAYAYTDVWTDNPHVVFIERRVWGVDAAFGWGGLSVTAAFTQTNFDNGEVVPGSLDGSAWLFQAGYLFPNTAWEVAGRASAYLEDPSGGGSKSGATEIRRSRHLLHRRARRQGDVRLRLPEVRGERQLPRGRLRRVPRDAHGRRGHAAAAVAARALSGGASDRVTR